MTYAAGVHTERVALVTLGCARNEVDSEELAARIAAGGFAVGSDTDEADVVVVNTCGFIDAAKSESIETLLSAAQGGAAEGGPGRARPKVVAVGCLAQRYGRELADELPEADAVLGFADYPDIVVRLSDVLAGRSLGSHERHDRRSLLPISPAARSGSGLGHQPPGHGGGLRTATSTTIDLRSPAWLRRRLTTGPVAPLKIASGCDRRCTFCAIPSFRGRFVSRPPEEVVDEARWLVDRGVRELLLVSENSTSYGKDLPSGYRLPELLGELASAVPEARLRVSYLQPAEVRPDLIRTIVATACVADYFELSFQHASPDLLRRMRRFGGTGPFLDLIAAIREQSPQAGIRSNVIVGFPGETEADVAELIDFLAAAQLDAVGVFGYSDEDGTEAATLAGHVDTDEIAARVSEVAAMVDELMAQRALARVGSPVEVLVEQVADGRAEGRAAHQGPDDSVCIVSLHGAQPAVGDTVLGIVTATDGLDLIVRGGDVRS